MSPVRAKDLRDGQEPDALGPVRMVPPAAAGLDAVPELVSVSEGPSCAASPASVCCSGSANTPFRRPAPAGTTSFLGLPLRRKPQRPRRQGRP